MKLQDTWIVYIHDINNNSWELEDYKQIYIINNIKSFWNFFNKIMNFDKVRYTIYITKQNIYPIWENDYYKNGSIFSIRIDSVQRNNKIDISTKIILIFSMLILNNCLLKNVTCIEFLIRKNYTFLKLWNNLYDENIIDKIPKKLLDTMSKYVKYTFQNRKINIKKIEN